MRRAFSYATRGGNVVILDDEPHQSAMGAGALGGGNGSGLISTSGAAKPRCGIRVRLAIAVCRFWSAWALATLNTSFGLALSRLVVWCVV